MDTIEGTTGDDTIDAVVSALSSERTLDVTDVIDGGEGTDTLNVSMTTNFAGFTADVGSMTGVEVLNLTNGSTGIAREFDATGATGIETVSIDATNGAVNVKDLATLAAVEVSGLASGAFTVAYDAKSEVVTSTTAKDAQSLKVTDLGTAETEADKGDQKYVTVNVANVESLNVESAGTANYLNLSGVNSAESITVAGAANTDVQAVSAATTSFDAAEATGNVTADLTGAAAGKLKTVATGSGDDKVTVTADDITVNATIAGGAGTDSLIVKDAAGTTGLTLQPTLSGFEKVTLDTIDNAITLSAKNVTDLAEIALKGGSAGLTLATGPADLTVSTSGANTLTGNVTVDSAASVTINTAVSAASAKTKTADTVAGSTFVASKAADVTVNVGEYTILNSDVTATEATSVALNVASGLATDGKTETSNFTGTLTANKASSVTVDAAKLGGTIEATKATAANITTGANDSTLTLTTAALENLTISAGKGLDLSNAATDVTKVQVANLTTAGHLTFGTEAMSAASNVTVGGEGTDAQATFGALGASTNDYGLTLTATGLAKNLSTGAVDAGNGALTVDVKGVTGTVTLASLDSNLDLSLDASTNTKDVAVTNAITSTAGNVTVDVNGALGAVTTGAINGTKGTVTVDASSAAKQVTTGAISGKSVVVNASGALTGVTIGDGNGSTAVDINAETSVTYTGAELKANGADIAATTASTALTVALTGGIENDEFNIAGNTAQTAITVSGDLDLGANQVNVTLGQSTKDSVTVDLSNVKNSTNTVDIAAETDDIIVVTGSAGDADTLTLGAQDYSTAAHKLTFTAIETVNVKNTATVLASNLSGSETKLVGIDTANDVLNLAGTDAADTIDLSKVDNSHTGNDVDLTITGGKGNDTIKLSEGVDTVVFADTAANNGVDTVTGFVAGTDNINLAAFENAGSLVAVTGALTTTADTVYTLVSTTAGDADSAAAVATAVTAAGTWTAAAATAWIVISDDDSTAIYSWTDVASTNGVAATELTLVGTLDDTMTAVEQAAIII